MKAKKHFGQHFLNSEGALRQIIEAGEVKKNDTVLEIGPGRGVLTSALLKTGAKVVAIEKDHELIHFLQEKFGPEISSKQLTLIENDILNFDSSHYSLHVTRYKVIANIPYYLTGQIFRKFLETKSQPERMVLLVQKEVADRIIARDKKESLLSVSVKAYGEPKRIAVVKARSFIPPPNVDSAIILIENISRKMFAEINETNFFKIVHLGFAHKRKQLIGNLSHSFKREELEKIFEKIGLNFKIRAEDLTLADWTKLTQKLENVFI